MIYLSLDHVLKIIDKLDFRIRDVGLLDSALKRPSSNYYTVEVYPTIVEKSAALFQSLLMNHPLVDGNKRLAWIVFETFLNINDYKIVMNDAEAYNFIFDVIENNLELEAICNVLIPVIKRQDS